MNREEAKLFFFAWLYNPESNDIDSEHYDREKVLDKYYIDGYVHTPYGRKIKVEKRKALSYLIQSTTADRVLAKAIEIDKLLEGRKSFISHIVHDEIVIDYSDDDRDIVIELRDTFEDGYVANLRGGKDYYNLNEIKL
jgi:DNA polymerase I-like protein with 3'-5' exonuclease and polymerase domains